MALLSHHVGSCGSGGSGSVTPYRYVVYIVGVRRLYERMYASGILLLLLLLMNRCLESGYTLRMTE